MLQHLQNDAGSETAHFRLPNFAFRLGFACGEVGSETGLFPIFKFCLPVCS
jgi:hypothetical protein